MEASLFGSLGSGGRRGSLRQPSKADSGVGSKQSKVLKCVCTHMHECVHV